MAIKSIFGTTCSCLLFLLLSSFQVAAETCVQPPPDMVAWWPFDEVGGGITADDISGSHPGAYANGPVQTGGLVSNALSFDGIDDYVAVSDDELWNLGSKDFTIEFWTNFSAPGGGSIGHPSHIFIGNDEGPGTRNKWFFALGGGFLNFHVNGINGSRFFPLAPFSPVIGQWYHLALTRNGDLYSIYVDGELIATEVDTRVIPDANAPLTIGQAEQLGFTSGLLDEMTMYDRALTQDEIIDIVDAGSSGKCKAIKIQPNEGGNTGEVTVQITGSRFQEGAIVKLVKDGEPNIFGENIFIDQEGNRLTVTFNLNSVLVGVWSLAIISPNGNTLLMKDSFTVIEGSMPDVWAETVGLHLIRQGRPQLFWIAYGNKGNIDSSGAYLLITGFPINSVINPKFDFVAMPSQQADEITDEPVVITNQGPIVSIFINTIPAGFNSFLPIQVETNDNNSFQIEIFKELL